MRQKHVLGGYHTLMLEVVYVLVLCHYRNHVGIASTMGLAGNYLQILS